MKRIAIIGCGAMSRQHHIGSVLQLPDLQLAGLIDADRSVAASACQEFSLRESLSFDMADLPAMDAAIVATPPHTHVDICLRLLEKGIHILCEKPLANSSCEAQLIVEAAEKADRVLATGFQKRFDRNSRLLADALEHGEIGEITGFVLNEGFKSNWDTANAKRFDPAVSLGGVLFESGIHWIDRLRYWFGEIDVASYWDDRLGGVEANCSMTVTLGANRQLRGSIRLSWTDTLDNRFEVHGTEGKLVLDDTDDSKILLIRDTPTGPRHYYLPDRSLCHASTNVQAQLEAFADAISMNQGDDGLASGIDGLRALELVEKAYSIRSELPQPWVFAGILGERPKGWPQTSKPLFFGA